MSRAGPQYLIVATSGFGDAVNANVPGTYTVDNPRAATIIHPTQDGDEVEGFEATPLMLGGKQWMAAAPWATLDANALARTAFFHHATLTANHGDEPRVLKLMGAVRRDQMLTGLITPVRLAPTSAPFKIAPIAMSSRSRSSSRASISRSSRHLGLKAVFDLANWLEQDAAEIVRDADLERHQPGLEGQPRPRPNGAARIFSISLLCRECRCAP